MQHSSLLRQQKDILASLFAPGGPGSSHGSERSELPGIHSGEHHLGNPAPELASPAPHDSASSSRNGGSLVMSMNTNNGSSHISVNTSHTHNHNNSSSAATSPIFPPSSPMQPSSPNTQLTMQLLGNLMQMQGLDGGFSLPSSAVPIPSNSGSSDSTSFGMPPSFNIQSPSSNTPGRTNVLSSPNSFLGSTNLPNQNLPSNVLLEHQIKLQQLQQLHQLQNQIFQQQMAIINSASSPVLSKASNVDMNQQFQQQDQPQTSSYTGLPTPGPSAELRPQQQSMEFVSPMILNNYNIDTDAGGSNTQPHSHSHTPSPMITSTYRNHDDTFSQQLPPPMAPQAGMDFSASSHMHHGLHRGIASAPEHLAFDIRSGREFDLDVSPLTSPWLGAYGEAPPPSNMRMAAHRQSMSHLASTSTVEDERMANGNKRTASPSTDESSPHPARKKHSPAILPGPGMLGTQSSRRQSGAGSSSSPASGHRGSKSTNSTPLLRGSRNRSKSGVGMSSIPMMPPLMNASDSTTLGNQQQQQQQPPSLVAQIGGIPEDSPSPVDLSVDPNERHGSVAPDSGDPNATNMFAPATRIMPVTPASIMNLGRLGMSSTPESSGSNTSNSAAVPAATASTSTTTRTTRGRTKSEGTAKGLKAILPAGDPNPKTPASNTDNLLPGPKKTSHKAAEQKRRDSLKTTFDDLRKLLPAITFEDTIEEEGGPGNGGASANAKSKDKDKVLPVRGPLLPGALPPRGPPKAGGDGPNKGVSKLQLLICGNQYIRTLKGRVERRDEEIARLRKEVIRLRKKVGVLEGGSTGEMDVDGSNLDEVDEELDLERDLDAVEGMTVRIGLVGGAEDDDDDDS